MQEPTKTESVSEIEHAAHNSLAEDKPIGPSDAGISILSVPDATSGGIVWRIEVPEQCIKPPFPPMSAVLSRSIARAMEHP